MFDETRERELFEKCMDLIDQKKLSSNANQQEVYDLTFEYYNDNEEKYEEYFKEFRNSFYKIGRTELMQFVYFETVKAKYDKDNTAQEYIKNIWSAKSDGNIEIFNGLLEKLIIHYLENEDIKANVDFFKALMQIDNLSNELTWIIEIIALLGEGKNEEAKIKLENHHSFSQLHWYFNALIEYKQGQYDYVLRLAKNNHFGDCDGLISRLISDIKLYNLGGDHFDRKAQEHNKLLYSANKNIISEQKEADAQNKNNDIVIQIPTLEIALRNEIPRIINKIDELVPGILTEHVNAKMKNVNIVFSYKEEKETRVPDIRQIQVWIDDLIGILKQAGSDVMDPMCELTPERIYELLQKAQSLLAQTRIMDARDELLRINPEYIRNNEFMNLLQRIEAALEIQGFTTLGTYCKNDNTVTLYLSNIHKKADSLNISYRYSDVDIGANVTVSVFAHEMFHAFHFAAANSKAFDLDSEREDIIMESLASYFERIYSKDCSYSSNLKSSWENNCIYDFPYAAAKYIEKEPALFKRITVSSLKSFKKAFEYIAFFDDLGNDRDIQDGEFVYQRRPINFFNMDLNAFDTPRFLPPVGHPFVGEDAKDVFICSYITVPHDIEEEWEKASENTFKQALKDFMDKRKLKTQSDLEEFVYLAHPTINSWLRKTDPVCPQKWNLLHVIIYTDCSYEEATKLLSAAGYSFTEEKADRIVKYYLLERKRHTWDVLDLIETLRKHGCKTDFLNTLRKHSPKTDSHE